MASYLRGLAVVLFVGGVIIGVVSVFLAYNDIDYYKAAEALSRHEDHVLFQAEYYKMAARHFMYVMTALFAGIGGIVSSAMLFGLSAVLQRLERDRDRPAFAR
jgi:hypothetical protein